MDVKAIIWDWGRTLHSAETNQEMPDAADILEYCESKGYLQAVVSLVSAQSYAKTVEERESQIEGSKLRPYFKFVFVTDQDKDPLFIQASEYFNLPADQIVIIGDRTRKEIRYANQNGHPSIWVQQGTFASELPDGDTGEPTYTVKSLSEIKNIL